MPIWTAFSRSPCFSESMSGWNLKRGYNKVISGEPIRPLFLLKLTILKAYSDRCGGRQQADCPDCSRSICYWLDTVLMNIGKSHKTATLSLPAAIRQQGYRYCSIQNRCVGCRNNPRRCSRNDRPGVQELCHNNRVRAPRNSCRSAILQHLPFGSRRNSKWSGLLPPLHKR